MSFKAIEWALAQRIDRSSAKFVLVAMASCVNGKSEPMVCFPSTAHLCEITSQDRKTVLANIKVLKDLGYLIDTGNHAGRTGQIPVFALNAPVSGTVQSGTVDSPNDTENGPVTDAENSTENAPLEESQKGDRSPAETVPIFPPNSTVFPLKESQISLPTVPKTGHGTSNEQGMEQGMEPVKKERDDEPEGFADFWLVYPLKVSRKAALRAYAKLKPSAQLRQDILVGLAAWMKHELWTKDRGKYRHHAATWLNQRLWEDEHVCGKVFAPPAGGLTWFEAAGFANRYEAENARCFPHNATKFRDGKLLPVDSRVVA